MPVSVPVPVEGPVVVIVVDGSVGLTVGSSMHTFEAQMKPGAQVLSE